MRRRWRFETVPNDLFGAAQTAARYFHEKGYKLKVEPRELRFPTTPTMVCKRVHTTVIVEVDSKPPEQRLKDWRAFCRSCDRDTRIALVLPSTTVLSANDLAKLGQDGIGVYSQTAATGLTEITQPQDLALNLVLPELSEHPVRVRAVLGAAYDQFTRSHWREGFGDACQVLEAEAKLYLVRGFKSTRIKILKGGRPQILTKKQVESMTLGKIKSTFEMIISPSQTDSQIAQALKALNPDRIGEAHRKAMAVTERRLRRNVGQHMWAVVNLLRLLVQ
ncbi:MAG: hypothetical protein ACT4PV_08625 [Planctomycetaceae bacterium]